MMSWLRRVPWWVWLLILSAVGIALNDLRKGGRERVEVVGAGPIARLEPADAPPGARLYLVTTPTEPPERAAERIGDTLRLRPPIVVWGFDFADVAPDRELLGAMVRRSRNAAT